MNLMSFMSLIAFFTLLITGVYVFFDNHKSRLHKQFLLLSVAFGMYALSFVFIYTSPTSAYAFFWFRMSSIGWTLFPAIFVNLSLALTGRDKTSNRTLLQALIFLPGIVFLFRSFVYSLYANDFIWFNNYWKFIPDFSSPWMWLFLLYLSIYLAFGSTIIFLWKAKTSLQKFRIQGSVILWMVAVGYLLSLTSNLLLPLLNINAVPEFAHLSCTIMMIGIGFAIVKYKDVPIRSGFAGNQVFDATSDIVFITDQQLKIVEVNNTASNTLGYGSSTLKGKPLNDFLSIPPTWPDDNMKTQRKITEAKNDVFLFPNNGMKIPVILRVKPVYDYTRDLAGYVFLAIDQQANIKLNKVVEERRELQYELTKAREKANESDKLKSTFLANISHELRTPLNGILGFAEILKLELDDSHFSEIADHIDRSGNRLLGTLNSIIDLSLIEANKNEIDKLPVDICSLVEKKAAIYKNYAVSKNLAFTINIHGQPIMSRTDQRLVGHVLSNLLDNAIKYTEAGSIEISCKQISAGKRSWAMISVKDSGIGIDKQEFSKIFKRFTQSSEGQSRAYEGMGIGLSICKHFVELLDGEIWVDSEIGKGSVFYVKIPSYTPDLSDEKAKTFNPIADTTKPHKRTPAHFRPCVLIVEDEKNNREYMKHLLMEHYDVDTSENGIKALDRVTRFKYDMIFMEVNLNREMTGIEAMRKIRKIEHYRHCPITAVTASTMKNTKKELLDKGFSHYLAKPFTKDQLIYFTQKMLG